MKPRIYIDTSILGGYFDDEFKDPTRGFFEQIARKEFDVYISEVTEVELLLAPTPVQDLITDIPVDCLHLLHLDDATLELSNTYIREHALTPKSLNDALHIALASVNRLDLLVSWNFKHIVNYNRIRLFNSINLKLGYPQIDIRSPLELI